MQWWQKALATVSGTTAFFYSFSKYNEYYEKVHEHFLLHNGLKLKRGEVHPITAWIARHTCDEEQQRRERIEEVRIQAELSDRRLRSMYTFWNSNKPAAKGMGRMAEDPEDLDRFLYGDEAPLIAAGAADNTAEKPADVELDEMAENGEGAAATRSELEDGEQEDDEEEDIEFVFGSNPVTEPVKRGLTQVSMSLEPGQITPAASASGIIMSNAIGTTPKTAMDFNAVGQLNGQSIYDVDLDSLGDKPWNKPGADITDYFNYGLNEMTWRAYCLKQKGIREEFGPPKTMPAMPFPMMPPGFPPMPPGMPFPFPPPGFRPPGDGAPFPFPPPPMFGGVPPPSASGAASEDKASTGDKRSSSSRHEESSRSRSSRTTSSSRRDRSRSRSRDSKRRR